MKKTIRIEGMSCGHCSARVTKALEALEGVSGVAVDLEKGVAVLEAEPAVTEAILREAIDDAGYDVLSVE